MRINEAITFAEQYHDHRDMRDYGLTREEQIWNMKFEDLYHMDITTLDANLFME